MNSQVDLKALEKRAFKSYFQDGLWDMYLGVLMLIIPLSGLLDDAGVSKSLSMGFHLAMTIVTLVLFILLKKKVTAPRIGLVEFGSERRSKKNKLRIVLTVSVAIGVALYVAAITASKGGEGILVSLVTNTTAMGAFAFANFVVVFSLIAYFLDYARAYWMGILFGAGFAAAIIAGTALYIMLAGLLFTMLGIVYFVRFLKNNPLPVYHAGLPG